MSVLDSAGETRVTQKPNRLLASWRSARLVAFTAAHYAHYRWKARGLSNEEQLVWAESRSCAWMKSCIALLKVDVTVHGDVPEKPLLLVPNHIGYIDILALGSVARTFFVSKAEVETWPVIGHIFVAARQLSIPRGNRRAIQEVNERIGARLLAGHSVCVFLEGTTSGGGDVLPFHGSLLQSAIDTGIATMPVGIRWSSADGAIDIDENVAYWKDHVFVSHLFGLLGMRGVRVTITFGDVVATERSSDRKILAAELKSCVVGLRETSD
ncbi:MAG: lysophospholipid acyltransferase family protein [Candidatus Hydrogenedentota bacterium]